MQMYENRIERKGTKRKDPEHTTIGEMPSVQCFSSGSPPSRRERKCTANRHVRGVHGRGLFHEPTCGGSDDVDNSMALIPLVGVVQDPVAMTRYRRYVGLREPPPSPFTLDIHHKGHNWKAPRRQYKKVMAARGEIVQRYVIGA